jgi:predicted secreted Zn-dependent protease
MSRKLDLGLATAILAVSVSTAVAGETSRTAYYPVQGQTAKKIYQSIKTLSPKITSKASFASTVIATKTASKLQQAKGFCSYRTFSTSAIYVFSLPRHLAPAEVPASTLAKWQNFVAYLKTHEEEHRNMWRQCFADYDREAIRLVEPNCEALDRRRETLFTSIKRKCVAKDKAFDLAFGKEVRREPFVREALGGR